ncbi:helix-turn-helix domain-containing protein [Gottfriedia acidiceleris]|uniref:helix-turn-helix domain-containing protein n=1 Tax=Gottfriedia acidiceleris TaxID=371036 RepID=UPI00300086B5
MDQVVKNVSDIFEQSNLHLKYKLRYFSKQGQLVIKYIVSKLRKYKGKFFESNSTIASELGCCTKTVQRVVKRAEQLEIFVVSSRKELTFDGKYRTTTNKIQLLPYKVVEVVKEVVETVRIVVKKVKEKFNTVKPIKNKVTKKPHKKPFKAIRSEIVPNWLNQDYVPSIETEEIKAMREQLEKDLQVFKR